MDALNELLSSNLNAVCHVGGLFSIPKNGSWRIGTVVFAQNKFYYIKSGGCRITIQGVSYEGIPGRWFFIPAGTPHSYANDPGHPFRKYWIHFDIYPKGGDLLQRSQLPYYVDVPGNSVADRLFRRFETSRKSRALTDIFRTKAALLELIAEYIRLSAPETELPAPEDADIQAVIAYVEENMHRSIRVEELARLCHLHPTHFSRSFKRKTGQTPAHFVQLRKLEHAKRLIEETSLSLRQIMLQIGYDDAAQFSKKFKSFYGTSPRSYRSSIRSMQLLNK